MSDRRPMVQVPRDTGAPGDLPAWARDELVHLRMENLRLNRELMEAHARHHKEMRDLLAEKKKATTPEQKKALTADQLRKQEEWFRAQWKHLDAMTKALDEDGR